MFDGDGMFILTCSSYMGCCTMADNVALGGS